jgi:hypothetical protein
LTSFLARYPRDRAVAEHHAQPLIQALNHRTAGERYPNLGTWALGPDTDPITAFTRDPQADFDLAAAWAVPAYALLTTDGRWLEPDPSTANAYLDDLDDDCVIVRLLCHC